MRPILGRSGVAALACLTFVTMPTERVVAQSTTAQHAGARASDHTVPVPSVRAAKRSGTITVDGVLSDSAWAAATPITEFTQTDPEEGKPGSERTEFRILYDDDALYVGARLYDSQGAAGVRTRLVRRDEDFGSDNIQIVIDGFHDHLGRAFLYVNPSGSKSDELGIGSSCCDSGWDPIWEAATTIDSLGWSAEMRIPLNQLRYGSAPVQTWGLQLRRFIHRRNELQQWAFWRKNEAGGPSRFGHLEGLELGKATRHLELLPYVAAKTQNLAAAPGDPFNDGNVNSARVGLDLKYLLSSNLTLDATINPDFGQVEVDPAVVNLTAFETSFPERRPFFVASSGIFSFGSFSCFFCSNVSSLGAFYSRRIGRAPTGADLAYSSGRYADVPEATTILGAAKITGRTSNGWTVGLLNAVTSREEATIETVDGRRNQQVVEPLANYFVGRLKKDLRGGNLVLGGIVSGVTRNLDDTFLPRLTKHAEVIGADWELTSKDRVYSLRGQAAFSNLSGDPRVVLGRQLSSARYFQRPDRERRSPDGFLTNALDSTATAMRGLGYYTRLAKESGNWMWEATVNGRTPGFETNDVAFLTRADYRWYSANLFRYWSKPGKWYRDFSIIGGGQTQTNFDGDMNDAQMHIFFASQTPQFWNWSTFYIWRPDVMDDRLLRGGPVVERPGSDFLSLNVSTDSRKRLIMDFNAGFSTNKAGGWGTELGTFMRLRPSSRVSMSFGPSWNTSGALFQYVRAVPDSTVTAFYGSRYIMSGLKQQQLALDTRMNLTFSPTMTFELYVQPLIASGHYRDFKEFDAPRAGAFSIFGRDKGTVTPTRDSDGLVTQYTIDPDGTGPSQSFVLPNPDFNFRSLRGSALFRWEYRPGSVLYVAWTHSRSNSSPLGNFAFSRDWQGMFDSVPDNILLVKASWWLPK
ncbi:MAG: DUF5916 domain-containing protein [Gemmatimonadota bacterium]